MASEGSIDNVRFHLFCKNKIPETLLSTSDALYLHIKRAYYQSLIWKKAYCPSPTQPEVIDDGWKWTEN